MLKKTLITTLLFSITLFAETEFTQSSINKWFNINYHKFQPHVADISLWSRADSGYTKAIIKMRNGTENELIVMEYGLGMEKKVIEDCLPDIELSLGLGFIINDYNYEYCSSRFTEEGFQRFLTKYMDFMEPYLWNMANRTYKLNYSKEGLLQ